MAEAYPWQENLWQQLASRQQYAHAYLLHGPAGIGKRDLAERLMARLLCHKPGLDACGDCKGCHLLAAGTHPDRYELKPAEDKKTVGVDDIRELISFVSKTAQLGGRKVVLVAEPPAEDMTLAASNALLKSLEEPAGETILLLLSHQPSRLLPTIKSRCVLQACPLPSRSQSEAFLKSRLPELGEAECSELLALSAGSPLTALRLHVAGVRDQRAAVVDGVKKLLKQQAGASQLAEGWKALPLPMLFDWFCDWAQLMLRYQLTRDENGLGLEDMRKVVQYLADKTPQPKLLAMQDWLLQQRQKVLGKANLNSVLLLEALLVQWASLPTAR
ncbi:DNA polymerase III subunit delta' [Pseudomonas sp. LRF_L74]|uniref:DNA polymerase III subunit delta' n=1 Tax=Pseudomonas sp. LRF_L74 TaxID=3369422 RepID=UPI003F60F258